MQFFYGCPTVVFSNKILQNKKTTAFSSNTNSIPQYIPDNQSLAAIIFI
jgi:hypothetical protein